ncbi:MAG TPA: excalibur calcium-binding domain-containing protein [Mycobacterium sp.]|nr:excalibur calcium-binding domain-containing protein [Mycobacterium sp.]
MTQNSGFAGPSFASANPPYANCKDAAKDSGYNIPHNDPAYSPKLDRDCDGDRMRILISHWGSSK